MFLARLHKPGVALTVTPALVETKPRDSPHSGILTAGLEEMREKVGASPFLHSAYDLGRGSGVGIAGNIPDRPAGAHLGVPCAEDHTVEMAGQYCPYTHGARLQRDDHGASRQIPTPVTVGSVSKVVGRGGLGDGLHLGMSQWPPLCLSTIATSAHHLTMSVQDHSPYRDITLTGRLSSQIQGLAHGPLP